MSQNHILLAIFIVAVLLCILPEVWKHPGYALLFLARGIFSIVVLYACELLSIQNAWDYRIQVNALTACISGLFGIPGVCLLYAIRIFL